jgi:RHH-type transcriptional regulator, rel operon repressor / antitoxin RelB
MASINLRISEGLAHRLEHLANATHRSKSYYVKKALEDCIEDFEDFYLAIDSLEKVKSGKSKTWSQEDLEARRDLED